MRYIDLEGHTQKVNGSWWIDEYIDLEGHTYVNIKIFLKISYS